MGVVRTPISTPAYGAQGPFVYFDEERLSWVSEVVSLGEPPAAIYPGDDLYPGESTYPMGSGEAGLSGVIYPQESGLYPLSEGLYPTSSASGTSVTYIAFDESEASGLVYRDGPYIIIEEP